MAALMPPVLKTGRKEGRIAPGGQVGRVSRSGHERRCRQVVVKLGVS